MTASGARIGIGTVQFGMDYGRFGATGRVHEEEVVAILRDAAAAGCSVLDTATAYGEAETTLGRCLEGLQRRNAFRIVTKVSGHELPDVPGALARSLDRLRRDSVDACLVHHFDAFWENPAAWNALEAAKASGRVAKIGFSLYHPEEVARLRKAGIEPDIVQVPYNVADQRFAETLLDLHERGTEIHVRSVFLQGVLLAEPGLSGTLSTFNGLLQELTVLGQQTNRSRLALAVGFALGNAAVDTVVLGVQSAAQLGEILVSCQPGLQPDLLGRLASMHQNQNPMVVPSRW